MNPPLSVLSTSLTSLLSIPSTIASPQPSGLATSITTLDIPQSYSWLGLLGYALLAMARGISGLLIYIITFTTITLPTVLFALFSTSLTFTMNFTTLYVQSHGEKTSNQADRFQNAHPPGLCVSRLMDREIPISEHVRATASRTSAQRASNRPVPGHARRRLEARSGKLPGRVSERYKSVWVS